MHTVVQANSKQFLFYSIFFIINKKEKHPEKSLLLVKQWWFSEACINTHTVS